MGMPINNHEFRPMVKNNPDSVSKSRNTHSNRARTHEGGNKSKSSKVGKYESDREDDLKKSGKRRKSRKRDVDAERADSRQSRASVGSFSDLVMEEYEKMNMDPMIAAQNT
jgi:hypothetical protein